MVMVSMSKWKLPTGWEWRSLSEVSVINPRRPIIGREDTAPTSFVPMEDVDEIEGKFKQVQVRPFGEVKRGYTYFEENDVLFAKITPSMENGKTAIARGLIGGFGFGTTEFHVFHPHDGIMPEWIHLYIRRESFRNEAKQHFRGAVGQQRVPSSFLEAYHIPIPFPENRSRSLDAQRRIVARIEALLSEVREMRDLQVDIENNTSNLMAGCIQQIFDQKQNHWITEELSQVAYVQTGTAKGRRFGTRPVVELPYLRVANVQAGYLDLSEIKTIEIAEDEVDRYRLHIGDLLLTEGGDFDKLGRGAVWEGGINPCIHQNHIFAVRFDQNKVLPKFAEYEMQSEYARQYFLKVAKKTTNLASINKTQLSAFLVRYPPTRDEQHKIIAYLDTVRSEIEDMQETQTADSQLIEQLEQSILAQAFRGEL